MFENLVAIFNMIMGAGGMFFALFVIVTGILDFMERKDPSKKLHYGWVLSDLQDDFLIATIMGVTNALIFTCGFLLLR